MIMSNITARRATVWNTRLIRTTERKPPLARGHRAWLDLSRDTHPQGRDVKQARSLMGSAVPPAEAADAQPSPQPLPPSKDSNNEH